MKKIFFALVVAMLFLNVNANARVVQTPAQLLVERLHTLQQRGVMFGHQDALFYGRGNLNEAMSMTFAATTQLF